MPLTRIAIEPVIANCSSISTPVCCLVYFFTPAFESLRALQHATNWKQTERKLGLGRTSLGSLSEASRVFDAELLREVVQELARQALPFSRGQEAEALRGLTAVDGSLFRGVSQMAWALWQDEEHRALKLHLHLDVFKNVPVDATVSPGKGSEPGHAWPRCCSPIACT